MRMVCPGRVWGAPVRLLTCHLVQLASLRVHSKAKLELFRKSTSRGSLSRTCGLGEDDLVEQLPSEAADHLAQQLDGARLRGEEQRL